LNPDGGHPKKITSPEPSALLWDDSTVTAATAIRIGILSGGIALNLSKL
jgi:hypothetical protein